MQSGNNPLLNKKTIIIAGLLIVAAILLVTLPGSKNKQGSSETNLDATGFYSPVTQSKDELVIGYGGSADPNMEAVQTQYRVFGLDTLPLSDEAKKELPNTLPTYLREYIQPVLQYSYIHIAKDTIQKKSDTAYSFDFYVDSPETYFRFERSDGAGANVGNPVTQIPWEGVR